MPALPTRRVVVTGLGLVTPLGVGVAETWRRLLAGESGLRQLREDDLPEPQRPALASLPCRVAGLVPREQLEEACLRMGLLEQDVRRSSRFMVLALVAAEEALADARWRLADLDPGGNTVDVEARSRCTGVVVGNGMSCTTEVSEAGALVCSGRGRRVSPFFVPRILPNMAAGAISIRHGLQGPNLSPSTACATGGHAVGDAFRLIQRGEADVMVAGASEACVDAISLVGFSRLKALSTGFNDAPTKASRPFDAFRDGFVMGEGAAVLVLEELGHARARGANIYAEVRGYGLSGDGYHITHPHPDGLGAVLCMRRALAGSGLSPRDVAYVNAHATSTPTGDAIEQAAILSLFTDDSPTAAITNSVATPGVAVSSTKGATGHLLGAAGAVEAAFTVLALRDRRAPPMLNLERPDPPLLTGLVGCDPVNLPADRAIAALSNSFGFGGTNSSLLFATLDADVRLDVTC
ncbi:hypothetical protein VOLCADRAFT_101657 [Volvox carteri f. nagariensis]|uniref:3-oxoacyl-[acyl-carrier-protein] synthase n=1 Tax=Volvox carteri f. nagariensis TaxID=3068 RepID=D8TJC9_VOLCA|nr:uncharacterized protein VOLCADRAFT_101657 [Volvox carteri f. nagariensis]EFJ52349.1 hypothetical protein VOLCADRAFT_101657 [Volvox carteri f. nagariensis]|eukprot:XP_002946422.1 hypothetical protein VOLCADRAFT_101657 [Volvox carteri f. nagariensis]